MPPVSTNGNVIRRLPTYPNNVYASNNPYRQRVRSEVTPDNVQTDYELPAYPHDSSEVELVPRTSRDDAASVISQPPPSNFSMMYQEPTLRASRPLPPIQAVPNYGELDLVSRKAHLDEIERYRAKMEGNLFTSSLTRLVATGGTVAGTVLGVLIGVKDAAHAYTAHENGQPITVVSKPQYQNLKWEVPLGLTIYLGFMAAGLYRQYSTRSKIKATLKDELTRSKHLKNEMFILKRGNHAQREEIKEIIKTIDSTKAKLGYTPGRDAWQITKGTGLAIPITVGALGAIVVSVLVCALAVMAAGDSGGCGPGPFDGCGTCGGSSGCSCCGTSRSNDRDRSGAPRLPEAGIDNWETVMDRPLELV